MLVFPRGVAERGKENQLMLTKLGQERLQLNWADIHELWAQRNHLVTPDAKYLLEVLEEKITFKANYFARPNQNYSATAGLILLAHEYRQRLNFVTCMVPRERHRLGIKKHEYQPDNCGLVWCCDHCAWRREMDAQNRFLHTFKPDRVWAVTVSFRGHLSLHPGQHHPIRDFPATHADVIVYWDAILHAARSMFDEGLIEGAMLKEELHILQLLPVPLVLPHAHLTIWAERFTDPETARMSWLIQNYRGHYPDFNQQTIMDERRKSYAEAMDRFKSKKIKTKPRKPAYPQTEDPTATIDLPLSIKVDPLLAQADLAGVLGYPFKPCNLAEVYQRERLRLIETNQRHWLGALAESVEEVIFAHEFIISPRRQPQYIGGCNPTRRNHYFGHAGTEVRNEAHQEATKELLREFNEQRKNANDAENAHSSENPETGS